MAYILHFQPGAIEDIAKLKKRGNKIAIKKLEQLLCELTEHPTTGTGHVEPLKGELSGYWSRKIDKYNRLIYSINEEIISVNVISALGQYGDK